MTGTSWGRPAGRTDGEDDCEISADKANGKREDAFRDVFAYHLRRFEQAMCRRAAHTCRHVGLELKFPVVTENGDAVTAETIDEFWRICKADGWEPVRAPDTGQTVGVRGGDSDNPDAIRGATGVCVLEFALAHRESLGKLHEELIRLSTVVSELARRTGARLLGFGVHPKSTPCSDLRRQEDRTVFLDRVLPPRPNTPHGHEGNVDLFTIAADSQVHVDVDIDEAVAATNLLNGLAGPCLALTANSSVWRGQPDPRHLAVRELFYDWWSGGSARCGVPARPSQSFEDYVRATVDFRPVCVRRKSAYLGIAHYETFLDYYATERPTARTPQGETVSVARDADDIDLHDRAFWWDARVSRFGTVESRICCQQPPGEFLAPAALVLGLTENLKVARELISGTPWELLRELRLEAAHAGLGASLGNVSLRDLTRGMLTAAEHGLRQRALGEECFLEPLWERYSRNGEPARRARSEFARGGVAALIRDLAWR